MSALEQRVREALSALPYPGFSRDIVTLNLVRGVEVDGARVRVRIDGGPGGPPAAQALRAAVQQAVSALTGVEHVEVELSEAPAAGLRMAGAPASPAQAGALGEDLLPGVRRIVAVASGKGGVGKSTVAVNLAVALARSGLRTALLDADIYGPSIPLMMGVHDQPAFVPETKRLLPFERFGVGFMSLGFLVKPETAVIWRGPMVMKALDQLLSEVAWGERDVMIVDMPPGTGDAQLTLSQRVQLAGAVVVSTPQDVALADAIKAVNMFGKVGVPVLGLVENMSYFRCPECEARSEIFGHGGAREQAAQLGVPFLGEIPLLGAIRESGDRGEPVAVSAEDPAAGPFDEVAAAVREALGADGSPDGDGDGEAGGLLTRFRRRFG